MEKVRLKIDELRVESFNTSDDLSQHRGTVNGHASPTDEVHCTAGDTCFATCASTCACSVVVCTDPCLTAECRYDDCAEGGWYGTFIGSGT